MREADDGDHKPRYLNTRTWSVWADFLSRHENRPYNLKGKFMRVSFGNISYGVICTANDNRRVSDVIMEWPIVPAETAFYGRKRYIPVRSRVIFNHYHDNKFVIPAR